MLNREHSQNFLKFEFFAYSVALLYEPKFPKGIMLKSFPYQMRAIFTESLVHETLFNTVVYWGEMKHILIMHNLKT